MDRKKCLLPTIKTVAMPGIYACGEISEIKVGQKVKPCIFLGYSEDEFGYRLWDLLDRKVGRSCDIVFMGDKTIEEW